MKLTKCPQCNAERVSRVETHVSVIRFCEKCGWRKKEKKK